ncbi:unnamed protein product [Arctia plantaginis]|uniref:Secreted protein n=1 Tax=Arctia plantaginis TaxID=874455 RepID=A0A8S1ASN4_ARCPL|nr:unnamed protein product [Arctia plantaginis]
MFKRTRPFYLIWLIQIFSAINTGWRGDEGLGRGDVSGCRRDGGRRMRAIASVSACHRRTIVGLVADIRAWRAHCGRAPDLSTSRAGRPALDAGRAVAAE